MRPSSRAATSAVAAIPFSRAPAGKPAWKPPPRPGNKCGPRAGPTSHRQSDAAACQRLPPSGRFCCVENPHHTRPAPEETSDVPNRMQSVHARVVSTGSASTTWTTCSGTSAPSTWTRSTRSSSARAGSRPATEARSPASWRSAARAAGSTAAAGSFGVGLLSFNGVYENAAPQQPGLGSAGRPPLVPGPALRQRFLNLYDNSPVRGRPGGGGFGPGGGRFSTFSSKPSSSFYDVNGKLLFNPSASDSVSVSGPANRLERQPLRGEQSGRRPSPSERRCRSRWGVGHTFEGGVEVTGNRLSYSLQSGQGQGARFGASPPRQRSLDRDETGRLAAAFLQDRWLNRDRGCSWCPACDSRTSIARAAATPSRGSPRPLFVTDAFKLKTAAGRYYQFTNRITREDVLQGKPRVLEPLGRNDRPPSPRRRILIGGASYERGDLLVDVELFTKDLTDLTQFAPPLRRGPPMISITTPSSIAARARPAGANCSCRSARAGTPVGRATP